MPWRGVQSPAGQAALFNVQFLTNGEVTQNCMCGLSSSLE